MKRKKKTFSWDDDDSGACGRVLYKIHTQVMGIVVVIITYPLATHNTKSHDSFFFTYFEAFCIYMYYYIKSWIYIGCCCCCCCCLVSSFVSFLFSSLEYTDTAISQRIEYTHESLFFSYIYPYFLYRYKYIYITTQRNHLTSCHYKFIACGFPHSVFFFLSFSFFLFYVHFPLCVSADDRPT